MAPAMTCLCMGRPCAALASAMRGRRSDISGCEVRLTKTAGRSLPTTRTVSCVESQHFAQTRAMRAAAALRAPSSVQTVRPLPSAPHRAPVQAFATKAKGAASRKSAGKPEAKPAVKPKGSIMAHRKLNTSFLPDSTRASAKADIVAAASETGAVALDVKARTTKRFNKETAKVRSLAATTRVVTSPASHRSHSLRKRRRR